MIYYLFLLLRESSHLILVCGVPDGGVKKRPESPLTLTLDFSACVGVERWSWLQLPSESGLRKMTKNETIASRRKLVHHSLRLLVLTFLTKMDLWFLPRCYAFKNPKFTCDRQMLVESLSDCASLRDMLGS